MPVYREDDVIVERESTASSAIWAIAILLMVALVVGAFFYSGLGNKMFRSTERKVDVNITVPNR